jgi:hypothetical protein
MTCSAAGPEVVDVQIREPAEPNMLSYTDVTREVLSGRAATQMEEFIGFQRNREGTFLGAATYLTGRWSRRKQHAL